MGAVLTTFLILFSALLTGCPALPDDGNLPPDTGLAEYVVFAWNDLGMHCLNPTYDQAVILPPYNTVWVQVVRRGAPPQVVTAGLEVSYSLVDNTYSYGKTDDFGADFAQFWDNSSIFGATGLPHDTGLNLKTPDVHYGLEGQMALYGNDHYEAVGVPVVPVDDTGGWDPYQVMVITVKDAQGLVVASTRATVPTSDEINCGKCHASRDPSDPLRDVLLTHDALSATTLASTAPRLCAECHGSPALGTTGEGTAGYLSEAIHGFHSETTATCYDCHPGEQTICSRSLAHTAPDGNCASCHGSLSEVAGSISGGRVPWADEPACADCHKSSGSSTLTVADSGTTSSIPEVDTGPALYRDAAGHGGLYCAACHGSPHAMTPSRESSDNYQAVTYQGQALTIGSCAVCHASSRGAGSAEFLEEHGGSEHASACAVCHTSFAVAPVSSWPHEYGWSAR